MKEDYEHLDSDIKPEAQWQKDLRHIKGLKANWDEEGAPRINRQAINQAELLIQQLEQRVVSFVRLYPTPLGGVLLKLETDKGRIKCEMGDRLMSYFVKYPNAPTEHHSFEPADTEHLEILKNNMKNLM